MREVRGNSLEEPPELSGRQTVWRARVL